MEPERSISLVVRAGPESPGWASLWRWLLSQDGQVKTVEPLSSEPQKLCQEQTKRLMQGPDLPPCSTLPGEARWPANQTDAGSNG